MRKACFFSLYVYLRYEKEGGEGFSGIFAAFWGGGGAVGLSCSDEKGHHTYIGDSSLYAQNDGGDDDDDGGGMMTRG
jgi:hypothetical protein